LNNKKLKWIWFKAKRVKDRKMNRIVKMINKMNKEMKTMTIMYINSNVRWSRMVNNNKIKICQGNNIPKEMKMKMLNWIEKNTFWQKNKPIYTPMTSWIDNSQHIWNKEMRVMYNKMFQKKKRCQSHPKIINLFLI
jgi:hypothetical protein